ncbi:MAG TPA: serine/threonine-protein kinase [Burkholderiales bacterium]|nr:serine/threonine-protein kinase [Burkholderiales bacterium]
MKVEKPQPQHSIGKYPVIREIGSGATSRVFLARDPFAERDVAIKVMQFARDADVETERMVHKAFVAEASLAGKLNHPHIVDIYDAVVDPDRSYLVMEYVSGKTLDEHATPTKLLPLVKVVEIIFKCIRALEYAFQHGVIHRDIKPGNVLLSEAGETKVGDFGASFQQRLVGQTTQLKGIGSPAYMSPEQLRSEKLSQQSDIYSLGVTMFRLLTGRLPYEAGSYVALTYAILNTPPPLPSSFRPDLPALLDQIVMKAIAKNPAERYPSWLEFGKDVTRAFMSLRVDMTTPAPASDSERFGKLRDLPFFKDFGEVELWEVVRVATWQIIEPGTVLMRENEQGDSFFVLLDGEVEVSLLGKAISVLKPGGCFGEILYFADSVERRTTTVTARGRITVMQIKAGALRIATAACQVGFNKAFMRVLVERLAQANRQLAQR